MIIRDGTANGKNCTATFEYFLRKYDGAKPSFIWPRSIIALRMILVTHMPGFKRPEGQSDHRGWNSCIGDWGPYAASRAVRDVNKAIQNQFALPLVPWQHR